MVGYALAATPAVVVVERKSVPCFHASKRIREQAGWSLMRGTLSFSFPEPLDCTVVVVVVVAGNRFLGGW